MCIRDSYIGAVQGIPVCFDAKECHTAVSYTHLIYLNS